MAMYQEEKKKKKKGTKGSMYEQGINSKIAVFFFFSLLLILPHLLSLLWNKNKCLSLRNKIAHCRSVVFIASIFV